MLKTDGARYAINKFGLIQMRNAPPGFRDPVLIKGPSIGDGKKIDAKIKDTKKVSSVDAVAKQLAKTKLF